MQQCILIVKISEANNEAQFQATKVRETTQYEAELSNDIKQELYVP